MIAYPKAKDLQKYLHFLRHLRGLPKSLSMHIIYTQRLLLGQRRIRNIYCLNTIMYTYKILPNLPNKAAKVRLIAYEN